MSDSYGPCDCPTAEPPCLAFTPPPLFPSDEQTLCLACGHARGCHADPRPMAAA